MANTGKSSSQDKRTWIKQQNQNLQEIKDILRTAEKNLQLGKDQFEGTNTDVSKDEFYSATQRLNESIKYLKTALSLVNEIQNMEKLSEDAEIHAHSALDLERQIESDIEKATQLQSQLTDVVELQQLYREEFNQANWNLAIQYAKDALSIFPNSQMLAENYQKATEEGAKKQELSPKKTPFHKARQKAGLWVLILIGLVISAILSFYPTTLGQRERYSPTVAMVVTVSIPDQSVIFTPIPPTPSLVPFSTEQPQGEMRLCGKLEEDVLPLKEPSVDAAYYEPGFSEGYSFMIERTFQQPEGVFWFEITMPGSKDVKAYLLAEKSVDPFVCNEEIQ